jgi:hypothetical protein
MARQNTVNRVIHLKTDILHELIEVFITLDRIIGNPDSREMIGHAPWTHIFKLGLN